MDNWLEVIDKIEYFKNYDVYEYEDEERPTEKVAFEACKMALRLSEGPQPIRVSPCGDSGLAFEWKSGDIFETINVLDDKIEHIIFRDYELPQAKSLGFPSSTTITYS